MIRDRIIRIATRFGVHEVLKFSPFFEVYLRAFRRDLLSDRMLEIEFFREALQGLKRGDLIFDIGGNEGYKSEVFLRLGARVVCVEPDQTNARRLRRKFIGRRVTVVEKAVSDHVGTATLMIERPGSALNTLNTKWTKTLANASATRFDRTFAFPESREVSTVTLDGLISEYGRPFLVKIDVEGHELNVLQGLSQTVPYLSFELNLPEFLTEGLDCVDLLKKLDPRVMVNHVTESGQLNEWRTIDEFRSWLASTPIRYMEVYAHFRSPPA